MIEAVLELLIRPLLMDVLVILVCSFLCGFLESGFEVSSLQSVIRSGGRQGLGDYEH